MDKKIKIILEYHGYLIDVAGVKSEAIIVPSQASDGIDKIKQYMKEQYGILENFMMVVNAESTRKVLLEKNRLLEEDDIIRVIPISSGG